MTALRTPTKTATQLNDDWSRGHRMTIHQTLHQYVACLGTELEVNMKSVKKTWMVFLLGGGENGDAAALHQCPMTTCRLRPSVLRRHNLLLYTHLFPSLCHSSILPPKGSPRSRRRSPTGQNHVKTRSPRRTTRVPPCCLSP